MHAKSDSDVTSPSPASSPKRPLYYVQSPSRDSSHSHDGVDKSSSSSAPYGAHHHDPPVPTPAYSTGSPGDSPSHPTSSYALTRHSRTSSETRFSGTLRSWSGRRPAPGRGRVGRGNNGAYWVECGSIQEEDGDEDAYEEDRGRCQVIGLGIVVFGCFFAALCLTIWGAARRYKPHVVVRSLAMDDFFSGQGTDYTGVPTKLVTINSSVAISVYNSAPTFGIHVRPATVNLIFSDLTIATGQLQGFYLPSKTTRTVSVVVQGENVPLYGAGPDFGGGVGGRSVSLQLEFAVVTRGYVVGRLVRATHRKQISCDVKVDNLRNKPIWLFRSGCSYR